MAGRLSCVPASLLFLARGEQGWDSGNTAPQSLTLWGRECWGGWRGGGRRAQIRSTRVRKSWRCKRGKGGGAQRVLGLCKGQ